MRTLKQPSFLNSISSYLKGIEKKPDKEMKPYLLPNWVNILFELYHSKCLSKWPNADILSNKFP